MIRDMDRLLVLRGGEQDMYGKTEAVLREMSGDRMLEAPAPAPARTAVVTRQPTTNKTRDAR